MLHSAIFLPHFDLIVYLNTIKMEIITVHVTKYQSRRLQNRIGVKTIYDCLHTLCMHLLFRKYRFLTYVILWEWCWLPLTDRQASCSMYIAWAYRTAVIYEINHNSIYLEYISWHCFNNTKIVVLYVYWSVRCALYSGERCI